MLKIKCTRYWQTYPFSLKQFKNHKISILTLIWLCSFVYEKVYVKKKLFSQSFKNNEKRRYYYCDIVILKPVILEH